MVNQEWLDAGHIAETTFLPAGFQTDHSPAKTKIFGDVKTYPKPFKFFNYWMTHTGFKPLLRENWRKRVVGSKQFILFQRCKAFKQVLRDFNFKEFSNISEKAKQATKELEEGQAELDQDTENLALREHIKELKRKAESLATAEMKFYSQKAGIKHLNLSDRNTAFFHSMVKTNNSRNTISFLCREDGSIMDDQDEIIESFVNFYKGLFGTEKEAQPARPEVLSNGYRLDEEEREGLVRVVTVQEIIDALGNINEGKAPGPDGFSSAFFKKNWAIIGNDFVGAVNEFFQTGELLKSLNTTIIALIPKTNNNPKVGDFRPIACCNVVYKVITKILAKRMESLLPKLVNQAQSAFVSGRSIMDNIHLATEIMRSYDCARTPPRCTVKIDLRKAYDTINWDFLEDVLLGLNFHPIFVERVMECVRSPSFSIIVNGSSHGFFKGKRGLRQGDPMSPALFILCMEYLSRAIALRTHGNNFRYHRHCASLRITHLAFADDLMLFSHGNPHSLGILKEVVEEFSGCSGLEVNQGKSNIFLAGMIRPEHMAPLINTFGFPVAKLPVKYLGIPLASRKLKTADYSMLIEKISTTVKKWNGKSLSFAGRLELIRSCLQGVEAYWLQAFPMVAEVISRIVSLARDFLWGSKYRKVAWKDVCLPKLEGGLGLRDLTSWNTALHAKILWNIFAKKESLWIQWVHTEIIRETDFWEWQPRPKKDSPLIKHLISIRDEMLGKASRQEVESLLTQWNHTKGTQAAYDWFRPREERRFWAKFVWKDLIPPKHSFVCWLALRGRLTTWDRVKWEDIDTTCALCTAQEETNDHLFFKCPETKKVWDEIRNWTGMQRRSTTIRSAIKWIARDKTGSSIVQKARKIGLTASVYFIWKARNAHVKDGKKFDAARTIFQIKTATYSLLYSRFPDDQVIQHLPDKRDQT